MTNISSPISILEFGSKSIKFGVYDNFVLNQSLFYEEKIESNKNEISIEKILLKKIIQKVEKDLDQHLNEISLVIDSSSISSLDISIQEYYGKKIVTKEDLSYLINQCKQVIIANDKDKNILHTIVSKIYFDNKIIENFDNISQEVNNAVVEIKFIMIDKKIYNNVKSLFSNEHIHLQNVYCASYIKSLGYINKIGISDFCSFIDIGHKKSSLTIFKNNKLLYIANTHIASNHITKDISKVLNIDLRKAEAEKLKFSKKNKLETNIRENKLIKQIINSRLEEIVELLFLDCPLIKSNIFNNDLKLFFTGNGSKVLSNNMLSFGSDFNFISEMTIIDEDKKDCCDSAIKFKSISEHIQPQQDKISLENKGIFERLFEYLSKK